MEKHTINPNDAHHWQDYVNFCQRYGISDVENFVKLYDIYELTAFMPPYPTEKEKKVLQELVGVQTESGYMDYQRSNNTFELIMQWREKTENLMM
jgi:hypothetical protein